MPGVEDKQSLELQIVQGDVHRLGERGGVAVFELKADPLPIPQHQQSETPSTCGESPAGKLSARSRLDALMEIRKRNLRFSSKGILPASHPAGAASRKDFALSCKNPA